MVLLRPRETGPNPVRLIIAAVSIFCIGLLIMISPPVLASVHSADTIDSWQEDAGGGFGNPDNFMVWPMVDYGGSLYAGIGNENGCEVRVRSGSIWNAVPGSAAGFGNANNMAILSMKVYNGRLYAGTINYAQGCEVWSYDGADWT